MMMKIKIIILIVLIKMVIVVAVMVVVGLKPIFVPLKYLGPATKSSWNVQGANSLKLLIGQFELIQFGRR